MGNGFEIPAERIKDIKKSQGELSFNKETKTIHWDLGAFNKPIATGSDINYAELTYIVEINDDILDASASEGKRYATNGNAKINYTNVDGERVEKSFPVPKFKPVFYEINKELLDKDGRVINKDIDFKLSITGPLETREIIVNPSKNDGVRQLTDLRNPGVYTFKEIDEGTDYNLEDYDVTYFINGQEVTEPSFTIDEDNLEDISLKIVNQEKSGSLKISKILEQSSRRFGLEALNAKNEGISFNFKVTGPDNYSARFSLPENGSWTKELNNLSLGTYTISEEISDEYSTYISVDNGESALRNEIEVDILNGQHEREVKVRNVLNNEWTLSAEKQWVGGPKAKPEVYFQLIRVNKDGTETKIAEPRQVIATKVTWKQSDLDVNANEFVRYDQDGQEYSYKVQEVDVNGNDYVPTNYSKSEEALSVTNTYTKKLDIPVQKDWDDNNDQDGKRPEVVEVSLYKDGKQTAEKLYLNASNQWSGKFTALEEYADGEKIEYSVKETPVGAGYTSNITGTAETGFTITNTREVEKTTVSGSKIWQDHDNQDGKRPKSITIRVLKDGQEIASQEVTAADNWQWEFTDLDKYEDGELIKYTLAEDSVPEYSAQVLGHDVINTHTPGKSSVQVTKKWDDSNNQDGKRPETVSVNLLADNVDTGKTLVLSAANNWTANFTNLDEFKDGVAIDYTVRELDVTNGYTASITGSAETGYLITNSREVEKVDVAGSKTWADRGNQDGKRPPSITIRLLKNGEEIDSKTVSASDDWAWEFTDLDKYEAGQKIDYRITEDVIPGYETVITDYDVKNTHKPGKVSVPVRKVWLDANDQDGLRPESVKVKLIANGEVTDESLILTENSGWSARFTDLDEFKDGEKIEYTVLEEAVKGYKSNIEATEHNGFKITNSRNPETINIEGSKTWDDNDNQDGKRPESITIRLLKNGEEVDKRIVSAQEAWQWSFEDLPKNEQGEEIDYTITEDIVSEYTTKVQGYNVTNTHAPGKTEVKVIKSWADANDQDGKRPESVSVSLFANGEDTGQKLILTATNNWAGRFHNLDKYKDGKEIDYTVVEEAIGNGYTSSISGNQNTAYTITNSRKVEKVDVKGRKTWADKNDQDGKRPESLTVYLLRNGEKVDSQVVSASDNWAWEFTDLDKYEAGELIKYTLTEDTISEYTPNIEGYNITNEYKPGKVNVPVNKVWADKNDQDGKRPEAVTVKLFADGQETGEELILTSSNDWTATFTDLDEYKAGEKINYTVQEEPVGSGYESIISAAENNGYTITNTRNPETIDIKGSKTWDDNDNQDGKRPESITVRLLRDGKEIAQQTVSAKDNWSWNFENLAKYKDGKAIKYTLSEDLVPEYTSSIEGFNITNTRTPNKVSVPVTKIWQDKADQDGKRPEAVTIKLFADGENTGKELILTSSNHWSATFTNLDEYKDGEKINYTVEEEPVGSGYESIISETGSNSYTITNIRNPEKINIKGTKTWDDNDNQDGKRPESLTVYLLKNGEKVERQVVSKDDNWEWEFTDLDKYEDGELIKYTLTEDTISEYAPNIEGFNITNSYKPGKVNVPVNKVWKDKNDQDGQRPEAVTVKLFADGERTGKEVVLTNANNWTASFTDLDEYRHGQKINYTVEEEPVGSGYESIISKAENNGYTITNTRNPEKIDIEGSKTWADNDNQDGKRPESLTVHLLKNGEKVDSQEVSKKDNWSWNFTDLDKYEDGKLIKYSLTEDSISEYTPIIEGYNITNAYKPKKVNVPVNKIWRDKNDQDGKRPEAVKVKLFADGEVTGKELILTSANNWSGTFTDLDEYKAGEKISYTVEEEPVASGYESIISKADNNGYTITNTRNPEKLDIEGVKTWEDENDQDGKRPESITVRLLKDGEEINSQVVSAEDNWSWKFRDLDKYENGELIKYTLSEDAVSEYSANIDGYNITNERTPGKVNVPVLKVWQDKNDQDGKRPEAVSVKLFADNEDTGKELILSSANDWTGSFTNLDEYKAGEKISYTVQEEPVGFGYSTEIKASPDRGFEIINTRNPETIDVKGSKTWDDNNDQDGKRPESLSIYLLKNGEKVNSQVVSAANNWQWEFTDLAKYENGQQIKYTISEETIAEYSPSFSKYNIKNIHTPGKINIPVQKVWEDKNNQDGKRAQFVKIDLYANGSFADRSLILNENNGWQGIFSDLDEYKDGQAIEYTVKEASELSGYKTIISGDQDKGYTVENIHNPEKLDISGQKIWDDNDNQDGKRPESVKVHLLADGEAIASTNVSAKDDWQFSFKDLDKYRAGIRIKYTLFEEAVEDYTTEFDDFNIINKHNPGKVNIPVTKVWRDKNDQDGKRPEAVSVKLFADNEDTGKELSLSSANNWSGTFTDLDEYENGEKISYTVAEEAVGFGYSAEIQYSQSKGYRIINSRKPETIDIKGTKSWDDNNDQDGKRPESITVRLLKNGEEIGSKLVTADDNWTYEFKELAKYEQGQVIDYSIEEDSVEEYTPTIADYDISNKHSLDKINIPVRKVWNDANDQDGVRPEAVRIVLIADNEATSEEVILNDANKWSASFKDLDKYKDGQEIKYDVREEGVSSEYEVAISGDKQEGFTITNSRNPETIDIKGTKTWDDENDQDGKRPESITVRLHKNGEEIDSKIVTSEDNWSWEFLDLAKFEAGKRISYTLTEDAVSEYSTENKRFNLINRYSPSTVDVDVTGIWFDDNDRDGKRPESIKINLIADGEPTGESLILTSSDDWTGSFTNLDEYKDGKKIHYTIEEEVKPQGYSVSIEGNAKKGYKVIHRRPVALTTVAGTKNWDDNNDQDGKRPESIMVRLLKNGEELDSKVVTAADNWSWEFTELYMYEDGELITYTVKEDHVDEYSSMIDGHDISNKHTPGKISFTVTKIWQDARNRDGVRPEFVKINLLANGKATDESLILTDANNWTGDFTNLDEYKFGQKIDYTVSEEAIDHDYVTNIDGNVDKGFSVTNSRNPEKLNIKVNKHWDDNDNQDGKRPASVNIYLLKNGQEFKETVLSADNDWSFEFTELYKYEQGELINYTIAEESVADYTVSIEKTRNNDKALTVEAFDITNKHEPGKINVPVSKVWRDDNNRDGYRPESIQINLLADGVKTDESLNLSAENNWAGEFKDLDKFKEGTEITYTVEEESPEHYEVSISGNQNDGFKLTNSHTAELIDIKGSNTWIDNDDQDGKRPDHIKIHLLANGVEVSSRTITEADDWAWEFKDLHKYHKGEEINYSLTQDSIPEYSTKIDGFDTINKHTPGKTSY